MKLKIKFAFLLIIISLFISCENMLFKELSGIFTASFETNGGTPIENLDCSVIEIEPITTKENFIFAGWYKQPSFKDKITFPYKLTENTKFYAKWLPTYLVSFESNGGTIIPSYRTDVIESLPECSRQDYYFTGWFTNPDLTGNPIGIPYELTCDITLYAKWLPTYFVNFETNGGSKVESFRDVEISELPTPTRENYIFKGWYVDCKCTTEVTLPYTLTEDTTLYAKWQPTYLVRFETNGGSNVDSFRDVEISKLPIPTRNYYNFEGWFVDEQCAIEFSLPYVLTEDIVLYAKWVPTYLVRFETNGGSKVESFRDVEISELPIPTRNYYNFEGWYFDEQCTIEFSLPYVLTEDIVLYAKWIPTYLVSFETNGGSQIESCREVEISELPIPTRKYYNFSGWFIDEQFITELSLPYVLTEDITLYAKWEPIVYQIQYVLNGGTNSPNNPSSYTVGDNIILENASNDTLQFAGWYLEENCVTRVETLPIENPHDIVLYAKFRLFTMIKIPGTNFEMSQTEVTQKFYESVMGENPSYFTDLTHPTAFNLENHPVESVSWYDAIYFCNKLSMQEGLDPVYYVDGKTDVESWNYTPHQDNILKGKIKQNTTLNGYRLPTKEEWQYAAKGGQEYEYAGSNAVDEVAWWSANSDATMSVAQLKANGYGLYDMSGNVWEWGWESAGMYGGSIITHYFYGGCWWNGSDYGYGRGCTVTSRYESHINDNGRDKGVGFRIVRTITE